MSVPVLSKHTVSTRASTSTAGCSWISTSSRASFTAATAKLMVVMSARPCGIMDATEETAATRASSQPPEVNACCHPPAASICPLSTTATIGSSAMVSHRTTRASEARSSELMGANCLASVASLEAWDASPTAVTRTFPAPPVTLEAENTWSPRRLTTGSFSPVSSDSSRSRPSASSTTASAGTWSPRESSRTSSSTISSRGIRTVAPSRSTRAGSRRSRAILSSCRLAEYSWTKPITTLLTAARQNSRSSHRPSAMMTAAHSPSTRLKRVNTWVRTMAHTLRDVVLEDALVSPRAIRSATASELRPWRTRTPSSTVAGLGDGLCVRWGMVLLGSAPLHPSVYEHRERTGGGNNPAQAYRGTTVFYKLATRTVRLRRPQGPPQGTHRCPGDASR